MKTPRVTSLDWEIRVTLDRRTVVCAAELGKFVTNIETWMKKDFKREECKIDWDKIRGLFRMIAAAKRADQEFYAAVVELQKEQAADPGPGAGDG